MPKLAIHLFAPFRVLVNEKRISDETWHGRIPRSLLKVLALSPRGKSTDELIELFWPDQPVERARQRLYEAVSRLRRTLTGEMVSKTSKAQASWPIVTFETGYRLDDSTWVDVREFHAHVAAVRQLRTTDPERALRLILDGKRLDPNDLLSEEPYADWAITARERALEETCLLEQLRAELLLEQGRPQAALDTLIHRMKLDPSCERTGRQAMQIALRLGDRMAAVRIFNRLQNSLAEEVGVEPSEDVLALYREIADEEAGASQVAVAVHRNSRAGTDVGDTVQEHAIMGHPPVYLTRFIGRQRELADIMEALSGTRLLTLQGTGGVGKTRLVLEAVKRLYRDYEHGACWIDLAPVHDGCLLPQTVAAALGVREEPGRSLHETVSAVLHRKSILMVLDNCEHLLNDVTQFVEGLLQACPGITIVGTSQVALGIAGETIYNVPALSLPGSAPLPADDLSSLVEYEAINLFVDRATAVRHGFRLTAQNAKSIVRICRRLDGIPLAVELAASRISSLTTTQVAERLDQRFPLLKAQQSRGPKRHQSLQALVDWSYDLLPNPERSLWEQLSVFTGSFSLETLEAMFAQPGEPMAGGILLDALTGLVRRSIVVAEESAGMMRYRLLETLREYGLMRLQASGREHDIRRRHLHWCLDLVAQGTHVYCRHDEALWLGRVATEYDEIRTALEWSLERNDSESALQMVGSLWWFWLSQGRTEEGRTYAERALATASGRRDSNYAMALHATGPLNLHFGEVGLARARLLESLGLLNVNDEPQKAALVHLSLGLVAAADNDSDGAKRELHACLEIARKTADDSHMAPALWHLGNIALKHGEFTDARRYYYESLALSRRMGYERGEAVCLGGLGIIAYQEGHEHLAVQVLHDAVELCRGIKDHVFGALLLDYLGWMARCSGDLERSFSLHRESLLLRWTAHDLTGVAHSLEHLVGLAVAQGKYVRAARLLGAQENWTPIGGAFLPPAQTFAHDHRKAVATLQSSLDERTRREAWQEGRLMRPEDVVAYALGVPRFLEDETPSLIDQARP